MDQMRAQAQHVGTEIVNDTIMQVDLKRQPFWLKGDSGNEYTADSVIIATGAQARWLGLPSEERFRGYGVSTCAICDGLFFRGKHVMVVVGGGNTAIVLWWTIVHPVNVELAKWVNGSGASGPLWSRVSDDPRGEQGSKPNSLPNSLLRRFGRAGTLHL